jgi:hypothetical protein
MFYFHSDTKGLYFFVDKTGRHCLVYNKYENHRLYCANVVEHLDRRGLQYSWESYTLKSHTENIVSAGGFMLRRDYLDIIRLSPKITIRESSFKKWVRTQIFDEQDLRYMKCDVGTDDGWPLSDSLKIMSNYLITKWGAESRADLLQQIYGQFFWQRRIKQVHDEMSIMTDIPPNINHLPIFRGGGPYFKEWSVETKSMIKELRNQLER